MSTVFISYRRQTAAGEARALFSDLVARLGRSAVFMDVDSISLGRDFRHELQTTLAACDVMLVLIDKDWAAAKDERGQVRLENAADFVRMEIEAGLKRDIAVTPVLVKGAQMPAAEELPAEIRNLAYRNGFELSHNRWESDVREMIRRLSLNVPEQDRQVETDRRPMAPAEAGGGSISAGAKPRREQEGPTQAAEDRRGLAPPTARQPSRTPLVIAGVLGVIFLGGAAAWLRPDPSRPQTMATQPLPATVPAVASSAQTLTAKDDPQSAASAQSNLGGTSGALEIKNTADRVGTKNEWKWTAYVMGPPEQIAKIRCVRYTLHSTFPDPVREVCTTLDANYPFALTATGWGTFNLRAQILFKDGSSSELTRFLTF